MITIFCHFFTQTKNIKEILVKNIEHQLYAFLFLTSNANEVFLCLEERAGQLAKELFRDLAASYSQLFK